MADNLLLGVGEALMGALGNLWNKFIEVIPGLLAAIVIFVVGWIVARILKEVVIKIVESTKIDQWIAERKLSTAIGNKKMGVILGTLVKWYIIVVFLAQAVGLIQLDVLKNFVWVLVFYIPAILGAALLLVLGLLLAKYVQNHITATGHRYSKTGGYLGQMFIVYIVAVMALQTVGFDVTILLDAFRIAFIGFALTIAIVIGISFGLAFKDEAKNVVADLKEVSKMK